MCVVVYSSKTPIRHKQKYLFKKCVQVEAFDWINRFDKKKTQKRQHCNHEMRSLCIAAMSTGTFDMFKAIKPHTFGSYRTPYIETNDRTIYLAFMLLIIHRTCWIMCVLHWPLSFNECDRSILIGCPTVFALVIRIHFLTTIDTHTHAHPHTKIHICTYFLSHILLRWKNGKSLKVWQFRERINGIIFISRIVRNIPFDEERVFVHKCKQHLFVCFFTVTQANVVIHISQGKCDGYRIIRSIDIIADY